LMLRSCLPEQQGSPVTAPLQKCMRFTDYKNRNLNNTAARAATSERCCTSRHFRAAWLHTARV
jgi:hypothetical protein